MTKSVIYLNVGDTRKTELAAANPKLPMRSQRFFKLAEEWYFATRENVTMGPFESQDLAKAAVADFVSFVDSASPKLLRVFKGEQVSASALR